MTCTLAIYERNGAPAGTATAVTNTNLSGSRDSPNITLIPATDAITAGLYSYEKWQYFTVTSIDAGTTVSGLKVWYTGTIITTGDALNTNATTTSWVQSAYAQPKNTVSTLGIKTMPSTEPTTANVGIANDLTGTTGYFSNGGTTVSDYLIFQISVNAASTAGHSVTMNYQYDEYA